MTKEKKLTDQQIDELFQFTRRHFVEWYDLQCELVDHLANDIEELWRDNPKLTFEEVKLRSFKKFGVFGFMNVIDQRRAAMGKRYRQLIWKEYVKYFKIPRIVLTVSSIVILVYLFKLVNHNPVFIGGIGLTLFFTPFIYAYKFQKVLHKRREKTGKKYMFEDTIAGLGGILMYVYIPFETVAIFIDDVTWTPTSEILIATFFVLFSLLLYIAVKIVPPQVTSILKKEHPEYKLA